MKTSFLTILVLFTILLRPATGQVIYQIEDQDGAIQYLIPSTSFASKGEHTLHAQLLKLLSNSNTIRLHTGKGTVDLTQFRDKSAVFHYERNFSDYIKWCTAGRIDLLESKNLNIKAASFLTVDKCTIGDSPLRYQENIGHGVVDAKFSLGVLIAEQLAKSNPKLSQGEPLVNANQWTNTAFHVDQEGAVKYLSERAEQYRDQPYGGSLEIIEPFSKISLKGRSSVEIWISKYGRYHHRSVFGQTIAQNFIGARAKLLADAIRSAYSNPAYKDGINIIPFEYVYMNYGVLSELARAGYKINETVFK